MGVHYFTDAQVNELKDNSFVINVSQKAITYEEGFKDIFIKKYNEGLNPTQIFREAGFDTKAIGQKRISNFASRTRKQASRIEGFKDTRKDNSGRPSTKELTKDEEIEQLKHKNDIFKQENDFLKRVRFINRKQTPKEKFQFIYNTSNHPNNKLSIDYLCKSGGVSRSGYYSWLKKVSIDTF